MTHIPFTVAGFIKENNTNQTTETHNTIANNIVIHFHSAIVLPYCEQNADNYS
jgi:hypothetical protein